MIGTTVLHYKILEKIGEGGMGVVYKARDTKLDRNVALKFLPQSLTSTEEDHQRFIREAKTTAALNHPNICTIYSVDEYEDHQFISMEYIEGKTLKEKIKAGDLALETALVYVTKIAEALATAHKQEIIHRDIKPENIMVDSEGRVKVMDFGLAKFKHDQIITQTGSTVGTLAYMSPEQIQGKAVDQRSDIFSLGIVLYEMLVGSKPFRGEHKAAMIYSIVNEAPRDISLFRSDIPHNLQSVVSKLLEKEPAHRYQNIQDLLEELNYSPLSIVLPKEEESIVVLPFENISPDDSSEYFSDGLTDEIITDLSKIQSLRVISRTSAMKLKGNKNEIRTIARNLNVQYVLEGSVRVAEKAIRVNAQLIDAHQDIHLWAGKYSGTLEDIFEIQEKLSQQIVESLRLTLTSGERRKLEERPIENVHSYEYYLRARQESNRYTKEGLERATEYLEAALNIEGENVLIFAGLGYVNWQYFNAGLDPDPSHLDKAEKYAEKIFSIRPDSAHGYRLVGLAAAHRGNIQQSIRYLKKAVEIDSSDLDALFWLANIYGLLGKVGDARPLFSRLFEIDPMTSINYLGGAFAELAEGSYEQALEYGKKAFDMEPETPFIRFCYCLFLAYNGKKGKAYDLIENDQNSADDIWIQMCYFLMYTLKNNKEEALGIFTDEVREKMWADWQYSEVVSGCFCMLGKKKKALKWLSNAIERGNINYPYLSQYHPFLGSIRSEGKFQQLMKEVKAKWDDLKV